MIMVSCHFVFGWKKKRKEKKRKEKKTQIEYKVINMDQWMGFYRFCNEFLAIQMLREDMVPPPQSSL
ncbi:hypothetical protein ACSBR2_040964 [Camellia fascicularis]